MPGARVSEQEASSIDLAEAGRLCGSGSGDSAPQRFARRGIKGAPHRSGDCRSKPVRGDEEMTATNNKATITIETDDDGAVWVCVRDGRFRSVGAIPAGPFPRTDAALKWLDQR